MKFDLSRHVLSPKGDVILEEGLPLTFSAVIFTAVITDLRGDENLSMGQKREIYKLKQKLLTADAIIELSEAERRLVLDRACRGLKIDVFGQVDDLLEHPEPELKEAKRA